MVSLSRWGARGGPLGKGDGQTVRQASVPCPKMRCTPTDPYIWALSLEVIASASCSGLEGLPPQAHAAPRGGHVFISFWGSRRTLHLPAQTLPTRPRHPPRVPNLAEITNHLESRWKLR